MAQFETPTEAARRALVGCVDLFDQSVRAPA